MPEYPNGPISRQEYCTEGDVRRASIMLGIDPEPLLAAGILPRGWQFLLLKAETSHALMRSDGFPGLGIMFPDLNGKRVVLAGRDAQFFSDIPLETRLTRTSRVLDVAHKSAASGDITFVSFEHTIQRKDSTEPLVRESQTYVVMNDVYQARGTSTTEDALSFSELKTLTPDTITLSQYSALCYNSHRIHLDPSYTREVEGYPDLVVNGGLATLFVTEFLRSEFDIKITSLCTSHRLPLFVNRPMTIGLRRKEYSIEALILNETAEKAVSIEVGLS